MNIYEWQEYWKEHPMQALIVFIFMVFTAFIGYEIHESIFWSIVDFLFPFIAWIKWLICHEVTLSVIKSAFGWFFV